MLLDEARVLFSGGHGGVGIVSFGPKEGSGPDGGNGGAGGNLYLLSTNDITLLNQFSQQTSFEAQNGFPGGKKRQSGKDGEDLEILLPRGTSIINEETSELIVELKEVGERILLCKGGLGGHGNYEFRGPRRTTPMFAQSGLPGEKKRVKLVLKLIADSGLIGLPNAGKSSLLNELTKAKAKTAAYPFTTLSPNLGVFSGKVIADIPGLIEGAADGKGLGVSFLKHIEKVGMLLHCVSSESENPLRDYKTVRSEIEKYNKELLKKPEIIIITKSDLVDKSGLKKIKSKFSKKSSKVIAASIHDWESLEVLGRILKGK